MWPGVLGVKKRKFDFLTVKSDRQDLEALTQLITQGKLQALINTDNKFDLETARDAYDKLREGRSRGKLVVQVT